MPAAEVALGDDGAVFACFLGVGRNHFVRDEVPIALDGEVELAVRFAMSMPSSGSNCHKGDTYTSNADIRTLSEQLSGTRSRRMRQPWQTRCRCRGFEPVRTWRKSANCGSFLRSQMKCVTVAGMEMRLSP